ncbi:hypothetical protein GCM10010201_34430 [Pilimelia columellifera subsp. columellifera]|uniref:Transposase putative helix-turn-helix domain-containing protein n=1 Tax=Pilimelia columellifera subsp. columellifera TaxID=706583 RepID=A0ABN3NTN7_9ACTN
MLTGRRGLLALTVEQTDQAGQFGGICRAVWNTGLEQRRQYRRRGAWINYVEQARQMAEAKKDPDCAWLADAPSHILQQTLRDLDQRLNRRWGQVRLPKLGWVRFRWTRPLGGMIRNATVSRDGGRWHISFCVEDGVTEVALNGKPATGVDRGVAVAVAVSDGAKYDRQFITDGERRRIRRLQQRLARSRSVHGRNRRADCPRPRDPARSGRRRGLAGAQHDPLGERHCRAAGCQRAAEGRTEPVHPEQGLGWFPARPRTCGALSRRDRCQGQPRVHLSAVLPLRTGGCEVA